MSNNEWYENRSDWYAPRELPKETPKEAAAAPAPAPVKKRRKGWTPLRVTGAVCALLALIVASSLYFGGMGQSDPTITLPTPGQSLPKAEEEMPSDPAQFFESFYESTTTDVADINIERADLPIAYEQKLFPAEGEELTLQELYERCNRCIVAISGYENRQIGYNWGTGVILSSDGLILTNTHVIEGCDRATVTLRSTDAINIAEPSAQPVFALSLVRLE